MSYVRHQLNCRTRDGGRICTCTPDTEAFHKCCGTTFVGPDPDRSHAEYHNDQYSRGRRAERVEIERPVTSIEVGDEIRLAPGMFEIVVETESSGDGERVIETIEGTTFYLASTRVRGLRPGTPDTRRQVQVWLAHQEALHMEQVFGPELCGRVHTSYQA